MEIASELHTLPWGWIGIGALLGALIMFLALVVVALMDEIRSWLNGLYDYWKEILGISPRPDRVKPHIWRGSKVQSGQTTTVPEEERIVTCGTIWVDRMYSERLKALSVDIQACLHGRVDTMPPEDPDPWGTMRIRLEALAVELDVQNIRHPSLPRADTVMLEETGCDPVDRIQATGMILTGTILCLKKFLFSG